MLGVVSRVARPAVDDPDPDPTMKKTVLDPNRNLERKKNWNRLSPSKINPDEDQTS